MTQSSQPEQVEAVHPAPEDRVALAAAERDESARRDRRPWRIVAVVSAIYFLAHLPFLARTPDDVDAVNFTLGIRAFDLSQHQPHPPGYPVVIALGKAGTAIVRPLEFLRRDAILEARVLAFWSAVFGAVAVFPIAWFYLALERQPHRVLAALAVVAAAPLYWFTGVRPMSDLPGIAVAFAAIALLANAVRRQQLLRSEHPLDVADRRRVIGESGRFIVAGAFLAAVGLGVRSQVGWIALPMLVFAILHRVGRGAAGALLGASMTFAIGVALWAVPLVFASGGPEAYWKILSKQAGEDIAGIDLWITNPTGRRFALGLIDTFITPWALVPLGIVVVTLAVIGFVIMLLRARMALALLAIATGPYLIFHLLFQETVTTRYALPVLPAVAYLAVRGLTVLRSRAQVAVTAAVVVASLVPTVAATVQYARFPSPVFRALHDVREARNAAEPGTRIAMHYGFAVATRGETAGVPRVPTLPKIETRELWKDWTKDDLAPLWFFADPKRTDLAVMDPRSRRLLGKYRWTFDKDAFMKGARPDDVDWYRLDPPGWVVGEHWELTPELAGFARTEARAQHVLRAFVRRRPEAAILMLGGRHLGARGEREARFTLKMGNAALDTWTVRPEPGFFLRFVELPAGLLAGNGAEYVPIDVVSEAADGSLWPLRTALEQFDVQSGRTPVYGFDAGWHEMEYNPTSGRTWRWTSGQARTRVHHAGRDLTLQVTGESPLKYFATAPQVTIRAGEETLLRAAPTADFDLHVRVPADALDRAGGILTLETRETFAPAERGISADRRQLGLRIYSFELK